MRKQLYPQKSARLFFVALFSQTKQSATKKRILSYALFLFLTWLFAVADANTAGAEQKCAQQNDATRVEGDRKVFHFTTTATAEQKDKNYPRAVATTFVVNTAVATTTAVVFIKQSVKHFFTSAKFDNVLRCLLYLYTTVKKSVTKK